MNAKDRTDIQELRDLITVNQKETRDTLDDIKAHNIKHYYSIKNIESIIQDDPSSSRIGLITQVNSLNDKVEGMSLIHRKIKRATVFLASIVGGLITFLIKKLLD